MTIKNSKTGSLVLASVIGVVLCICARAQTDESDWNGISARAHARMLEKNDNLPNPIPKRVDEPDSSSGDSTVPCSSLDHSQDIPFGTRCTTSKGKVYTQVSHDFKYKAWKGPDGLIWTNLLSDSVDYNQAINVCKDFSASLPTKTDFNRAEAAGILEVLPFMNEDYFWGADSYIFDSLHGRSPYSETNLNYGRTIDRKKYPNAVVCVAIGKHYEMPSRRDEYPECQKKFGTPQPAHKTHTSPAAHGENTITLEITSGGNQEDGGHHYAPSLGGACRRTYGGFGPWECWDN